MARVTKSPSSWPLYLRMGKSTGFDHETFHHSTGCFMKLFHWVYTHYNPLQPINYTYSDLSHDPMITPWKNIRDATFASIHWSSTPSETTSGEAAKEPVLSEPSVPHVPTVPYQENQTYQPYVPDMFGSYLRPLPPILNLAKQSVCNQLFVSLNSTIESGQSICKEYVFCCKHRHKTLTLIFLQNIQNSRPCCILDEIPNWMFGHSHISLMLWAVTVRRDLVTWFVAGSIPNFCWWKPELLSLKSHSFC